MITDSLSTPRVAHVPAPGPRYSRRMSLLVEPSATYGEPIASILGDSRGGCVGKAAINDMKGVGPTT